MKRSITIITILTVILTSFSVSFAASFESGMNEAEKISGITITGVKKGTGGNVNVEKALKSTLVDGKYNVEGQVQASNTTVNSDTGEVITTGGHWQVNAKSAAGDYLVTDMGEVKTVNAIALHGGTATTSVISDNDIVGLYVKGDDGENVKVSKHTRNEYAAASTINGRQVVYLYFEKAISTKTLTVGFDTALSLAIRVCEVELWNTADNKLTGNPASNFFPLKGQGSDVGTDASIKEIGYILTDAFRSQSGGIYKWAVSNPTNLKTSPYVEYNVDSTINKVVIYSGYQSAVDWVIPENVCITYTIDGTTWKTAKILANTVNMQRTNDPSQGWASSYTIGAITPKSIRIYVSYGRGGVKYDGTFENDNREAFRIREIETYFDDTFTESTEESTFALRMDETAEFANVNSSTMIKKDTVLTKGNTSRTFMLQFPTPVNDKVFTVNNMVATPVFAEQTFVDYKGTGKVYTATVTLNNMTEGSSWSIKADDTEVYNFSVQEDYAINGEFNTTDTQETYMGTITNNTANDDDLQLFLIGKDQDGKMVSCKSQSLQLTAGATENITLSSDINANTEYSVYIWDTYMKAVKKKITPCKAVDLNDEALSYYGRWSDVDGAKYANWNHPYIKFEFTGKDLMVDAENAEYLAVTIDGTRKTYTNVNGCINVAPENLADKKHTAIIRLWKTSIAQNQAIKGIYIGDGETVSKIPQTTNVLQFIGDSITTDPASYSYTIPEKLGCDFSIISLSGIALQDGCGWYQKKVNLATTELIGMESAYFNLQNPLYDGTGATCTKYDFENEDPNVIVINLGANDNEFIRLPETYKANGKTPQTYIDSYVDFVHNVRDVHPNAEIYIMESLIHQSLSDVNTVKYDVLIPAQQEVYNQLKSDTKIHYIDTSDWNVQSNDNIHPTPDEYARLRDVVLGVISGSLK